MRWLALLLLLTACGRVHVGESPDVFLPPEMQEKLQSLQAFPGAWWNFVVAVKPQRELCAAMKADRRLSRAGCDFGPADLRGLLQPWQEDLPLRSPPPDRAGLLERMNLALAKASAPIGEDFVEVLRADPLGSFEKLLELQQTLSPVRLEYRESFLRFPGSEVGAIPVLMRFPAADTEKTEEIRRSLQAACDGRCGELFFIGPHFGTARNKAVIKSDMGRVTAAGGLLFSLFLLALALTGRWPALLIALPVGGAVWGAGALLSAWKGGIHGLTIAFGSGLVGIALDYALHAFVRKSGGRLWQANFLGFLTTAAVFAVLAFSAIPLVRELMLFGLIGITLAYLLFYGAIPRLPERFHLEPFALGPVELKAAPWLLAGCGALLAASAFLLQPDFSVRSLDQAPRREKQVAEELFRTGGEAAPLLRIHAVDPGEAELEREQRFAEARGITLVNRLTFLPPLAEQERNLAAWKKLVCGRKALEQEFSETYRRFFAPFFARASCKAVSALAPRSGASYTEAIEAGGRSLSTFFPRDAKASAELRAEFPGSFAIRDLAELFPHHLEAEMRWMIPLALLAVLLLVLALYRRPALVLAVFVPWLAAAALALPLLALSPTGFGFVSLIGLLMVFGMATDYGIFCVNYYLHADPARRGIWTSLAISGGVTILGFLPLLFAEHIVLRQLGESLCLGTVGTLLGVFFLQPWCTKRALRS